MNSKPPKKIVIIVESIAVERSSGAKANVALIKNLHKCGYEIQVYHYTRKSIDLPDIFTVGIKEKRWSLLFFLSRMERYIRSFFKVPLNKPLEKHFGFSFTLFNDRNSIVSELKKIKDFEPDLVLTLSQGGSFRPHHALLQLPEWHSKWMAYIHDPYPMHHYPKPYTWTEPGYQKKEGFIEQVSKKAAYSAFPSKLLLEWMGKFSPGFLKTGVVIPHQIINLRTNDVDFPDYFDPEKFNILHAGNLLDVRNPKFLLKAFMKFLKNQPEARSIARLVFLGGNNHRVEEMIGESEKKYIYIGKKSVPFKEACKMQWHTAVNIILEAKAESSPFLPGKFPHCISAGKPILLLGPAKSEAQRLLGKAYEYRSEIDDEEKITELIEDLYLQWKESPEAFKMERADLKEYCSEIYLKEVIDKIKLRA